jgi:hypothetical protein
MWLIIPPLPGVYESNGFVPFLSEPTWLLNFRVADGAFNGFKILLPGLIPLFYITGDKCWGRSEPPLRVFFIATYI